MALLDACAKRSSCLWYSIVNSIKYFLPQTMFLVMSFLPSLQCNSTSHSPGPVLFFCRLLQWLLCQELVHWPQRTFSKEKKFFHVALPLALQTNHIVPSLTDFWSMLKLHEKNTQSSVFFRVSTNGELTNHQCRSILFISCAICELHWKICLPRDILLGQSTRTIIILSLELLLVKWPLWFQMGRLETWQVSSVGNKHQNHAENATQEID